MNELLYVVTTIA